MIFTTGRRTYLSPTREADFARTDNIDIFLSPSGYLPRLDLATWTAKPEGDPSLAALARLQTLPLLPSDRPVYPLPRKHLWQHPTSSIRDGQASARGGKDARRRLVSVRPRPPFTSLSTLDVGPAWRVISRKTIGWPDSDTLIPVALEPAQDDGTL